VGSCCYPCRHGHGAVGDGEGGPGRRVERKAKKNNGSSSTEERKKEGGGIEPRLPRGFSVADVGWDEGRGTKDEEVDTNDSDR